MLELGADEKKMHWEIGELISKLKLDTLIAVGPLMVNAVRAAEKAGMRGEMLFSCQTNEEALDILRDIIDKGDMALVKGSRGMRMENIVTGLQDKFSYQQSGKQKV